MQVPADADCSTVALGDQELLVLGSDGLWDALRPDDVAEFLLPPVWGWPHQSTDRVTHWRPGQLGARLAEEAYARGSSDNIACVVVDVRHGGPSQSGDGVGEEEDVRPDGEHQRSQRHGVQVPDVLAVGEGGADAAVDGDGGGHATECGQWEGTVGESDVWAGGGGGAQFMLYSSRNHFRALQL